MEKDMMYNDGIISTQLVSSEAAAKIIAPWIEHIANIISSNRPGSEIQLQHNHQGQHSDSFKITTGDSQAFLKVFKPNSSTSNKFYTKERDALIVFQNQSNTPKHYAHCDLQSFLVTEWIEGETVHNKLSITNIDNISHQIGISLAEWEYTAPEQSLTGNWYTYLQKILSTKQLIPVERAKDLLLSTPLCGQSLAQNDCSLSNLIIDKSDKIWRCDYEKSSFRPRGWDYITCFLALIQKMPTEIDNIANGLIKGFSSKNHGVLLHEELNMVAKILYCCLAMDKEPAYEVFPWQ